MMLDMLVICHSCESQRAIPRLKTEIGHVDVYDLLGRYFRQHPGKPTISIYLGFMYPMKPAATSSAWALGIRRVSSGGNGGQCLLTQSD